MHRWLRTPAPASLPALFKDTAFYTCTELRLPMPRVFRIYYCDYTFSVVMCTTLIFASREAGRTTVLRPNLPKQGRKTAPDSKAASRSPDTVPVRRFGKYTMADASAQQCTIHARAASGVFGARFFDPDLSVLPLKAARECQLSLLLAARF